MWSNQIDQYEEEETPGNSIGRLSYCEFGTIKSKWITEKERGIGTGTEEGNGKGNGTFQLITYIQFQTLGTIKLIECQCHGMPLNLG